MGSEMCIRDRRFAEELRIQGVDWADFDAAYDFVAGEPDRFGVAHTLKALGILGGYCGQLHNAQRFE